MRNKAIHCSQLTIMLSACIPLALIRLLEKAASAVSGELRLVIDSRGMLDARKHFKQTGLADISSIAAESDACGGISAWEAVIFARVGGLYEGGARPRYTNGTTGSFCSWCLSGQPEMVEQNAETFSMGCGVRSHANCEA